MNSEGKYLPVNLIKLYFLDITKPLFCSFNVPKPQNTIAYMVNLNLRQIRILFAPLLILRLSASW